jgi:hypothetical protein
MKMKSLFEDKYHDSVYDVPGHGEAKITKHPKGGYHVALDKWDHHAKDSTELQSFLKKHKAEYAGHD